MTEKSTDLIDSFINRRIGRRELARRLALLGIGAGLAGRMVNAAASQALAADFDWRAYKGASLKLLLNKHPYADAMVADLDAFRRLTGIAVSYDVFPEDVYFDKVTAALSSRSNAYDVLMTGAYQTWQYGPAGWLVDLNEYVRDASRTHPSYDWEDVIANLRASTSWSGKPGDAPGGPGARQWALPWGFEVNVITYNKRLFDRMKLQPPAHMEQLIETGARISRDAGGGIYGVGTRGSRSWATIHPGFLSGYANYGARDFEVSDGRLISVVNSKAAKAYTALFVKMVQQGGPKNWADYTWYQVSADLGAGASAMIYDADTIGYFANSGDTRMRGELGYAPLTPDPHASGPTSNVWIWSLAMSQFSRQKDAAWMFLQWATGTDHLLFGARGHEQIDPVRMSIWQDEEFTSKLDQGFPDFRKTYAATEPDAKIYFTPQPLFFSVTTEWAAALQEMVAGRIPVNDGLDKLAEDTNQQMRRAGLS